MSTSVLNHRTGRPDAASSTLVAATDRDRAAAGLVPPTVRTRGAQPLWLDLLLRASGPVVLVAAWFAASVSGAITSQQFPAPWEVWSAFTELARSGDLWANLSVSLRRAAIGLVIGIAVGHRLRTVPTR